MKVGFNNTVEIDPDAAAQALGVPREDVARAVRARMEALILAGVELAGWATRLLPDERT